ncbi:unnamed protein product [Paramecium pentaurelia]|uniref:Uncharacterized protein n=1 Tax=Paramecium pentaurelia TaxID=43138 RepID=A0A8S1XPX3_9CILI|nr:unnamed protein product [Paramecium pentaurelia]
MNQSYTRIEINLETVETIWIQQTGFLERITKQSRVNFYYFKNMIILEGKINQCNNAAKIICQKVYEDFIMQIEQFHNEEEIQPFYQLFQQPQYRELCQNNQGFRIYSKQSLMKEIQNMMQQGYQPNYPVLPQHFIITWFPRTNMFYIQQCIYNMIGYQYSYQGLKQQFKYHKQLNITVLEAISIYLILDVQNIMNQFSSIIEINQIPNQCFLVIKANNQQSFQDVLMILDNHLVNNQFWPITYLEMKLSSNKLFCLEKTIDDQVRTTSGVKIYSYDEVLHESQRLDKIFDINLKQIIIERYCSDQIFVYADQDKQAEITDQIIQIVRKPKQNIRVDQEDRFQQQQFYYKETSNKLIKNKKKANQKKRFPFIDNHRKSYQDQFQFYDQKQFELQKNSHIQYPNKTFREQTIQNEDQNNQFDVHNQFDSNNQFDPNNQIDIPLKNYKKCTKNFDMPKRTIQNKKKQKHNYQRQEIMDISLNNADVKIYQNTYNYQYQQQQYQEEEKSSQLLQVEDLNKSIQCQVIKIELFQYQIIYTQNNLQSNRKINFKELKKSFEEFQNIYYNLQHEILLQFDTDSIIMNIKCKQQDEINLIKQIFHKYFLQSMYFVTQNSTQALNLVDTLKQNCKVEYFPTKTELSGFLNEQQFKELELILNGQQLAIKINNYSYRHQQFLKGKFNDFMNQQSSNQNSSILDISKQGTNNTKVIIISEDQLKYLQQEFPDLEACQLRKFNQYFDLAFYFVQIEDIEEILENAKVEFKRRNEIYVKDQVQMKKQENQKKGWMIQFKNDQNYEASELYCYNMMEAFYTELLNDINDIQMNIEEYQANQNLSMYYEAIIELGDKVLNPNDPDSIEKLLFKSDFKFQPKMMSRIDQPQGTFITLWIRNQEDNLSQMQMIQKNKILPRGYIQKK